MGSPGGRADSRVKVMSLSLGGLRFLGLSDTLRTGGHPLGVWRRREKGVRTEIQELHTQIVDKTVPASARRVEYEGEKKCKC